MMTESNTTGFGKTRCQTRITAANETTESVKLLPLSQLAERAIQQALTRVEKNISTAQQQNRACQQAREQKAWLSRLSGQIRSNLSQAKPDTITKGDVARLWIELTQIFGYQFTKVYGTKDGGAWFAALKNLTVDDLDYGFRYMLRKHHWQKKSAETIWPPNAMEFCQYCERRLADFGLPVVSKAFEEASRNSYLKSTYWTHPLIKIVFEAVISDKSSPLYAEHYDKFRQLYCYLAYCHMQDEHNEILPIAGNCEACHE